MKAIITVGVSASGKTTWVNHVLKTEKGWCDINRDWIRFNVVCPGANWSNYKFNGKNEKQVTEIHGNMIMEAWSRGENIIISDTNLNTGRRNNLINTLKNLGYQVEVKDFHVAQDTAIKRDRLRANGVGEGVIYRQFQDWNNYVGRVTYVPDTSLPKAIIVDVDGTIAQMDGRGPFEWHKVGEDKPRSLIIEMVKSYSNSGYEIIICSGRDEVCRDETIGWLDKHLGNSYTWSNVFMRKNGDFRKDNAVKEEIFWTHLAHKYNICGVVDDRPQVVRLWLELKVPNVICVGNPYLEF